ncbi:hypothetical protein F5Y13DRAFT_167164 [Hypoxylon sp. FL1857]|nr:hypothetical protein F5Y13DRAFT_167164 [Hypoxylon sp. FL1857]
MPSSNQINALLAMPASLRLVLIGAPSRVRSSPSRLFSTSLKHYAASKYPDIAAFLIPEFRTTQPSEISPDELFKTSSIPSAPDNPLQDELTSLFTKNPPIFQYGESDFYKLKKNTRVPEVCILGRSNVGKSSFVNALANRHSNVLAYVSSKAGKTRAINTYGFGPAPLPKDIAAQAAQYKGKEDIPTHAFYLVDMPGYGYASLKEWGHNITLYLTKRIGVKGAIVLIDAEVGPKQTDLQLLELLSTAGKRTAIVLTKADKVKGGLNGLRETCTKVWDAILEIEKKQDANNWPWEKEIFVTAVGAKDRAVISSTVTTGRLAVARLAGLAKDNRPKVEKNQKWSGKVISFEDLQYMPSKSATTTSQVTNADNSSPLVRASPQNNGAPKKIDSPFAGLEQASAEEHRGGRRLRPRSFGSQGLGTVARSRARAFHSSAGSEQEEQKPRSQPPTQQELNIILDDFVSKLKSINTTANYARNMRLKHDRQPPVPPERRNALERGRQKQARFLQRRFPRDTARIRAVHEKRLSITERQAREQEEEKQWELVEARKALETREALETADEDWSTGEPASDSTENTAEGSDEYLAADMFKTMVTSPEYRDPMEKKKNKKEKKKASKKKDGRAGKEKKEGLDEFEAKFARAMRKYI